MAQTPEGRVKKMVKKALDDLGHACYRFMPVQSGFGAKTLDYLLCINGRFVAIETKAPGKNPTPLQSLTIHEIEAAGGIALVVSDEATLDSAMRVIKALINGSTRSTALANGSAEASWGNEQHGSAEQQA